MMAKPLDTGGDRGAVYYTVALSHKGDAQLMYIRALPEESEVEYHQERENLTVLVHVKGATARDKEQQLANILGSPATINEGAQPWWVVVDLVAVLATTGSMAAPNQH
ncbi:hypothetical protein L7F22_061938 [Adiantum nelumboides]|nr:hypothetical protein [Adiantum nelumboides]